MIRKQNKVENKIKALNERIRYEYRKIQKGDRPEARQKAIEDIIKKATKTGTYNKINLVTTDKNGIPRISRSKEAKAFFTRHQGLLYDIEKNKTFTQYEKLSKKANVDTEIYMKVNKFLEDYEGEISYVYILKESDRKTSGEASRLIESMKDGTLNNWTYEQIEATIDAMRQDLEAIKRKEIDKLEYLGRM